MPNGGGIWKQGTCDWCQWEGYAEWHSRNEEDYDSWHGWFCVQCHRWIILWSDEEVWNEGFEVGRSATRSCEQVDDLERRIQQLELRIKQMEVQLEELEDTMNQTVAELCRVINLHSALR